MAAKKKKYPNPRDNHHEKDGQENPKKKSKGSNISSYFFDQIKEIFSAFDTSADFSEANISKLYSNKEYLDQFWEYFKTACPNLFDKIDQKDLPAYIQAIQHQWFSLANIKANAGKLQEEFKAEDTESHAIKNSLSELKKFCAKTTNNVPEGTFKKFADMAWFTDDTFVISADGEIHIIDNLIELWQKFLETEGITLDENSTKHAEGILTPNYNPIERIMVSTLISKMGRELKGSLKTSFSAKFPLPITIFSKHQDLVTFRDELKDFLHDHASKIDESLAKKLDSVLVTNGDIEKGLFTSVRNFDDTKWFSDQEKYFKNIFNHFITRQLFEEVGKKQGTIDHYIAEMNTTFKEFPPYIHDILKIYPYNAALDPLLNADLERIQTQISELDAQYSTASDDKRKELGTKIKALKQEKNNRKWQVYITFLKTKDAALADVFAQLVTSNFDFSTLSPDQQQLIINVLVKNKLEDTIKNKLPDLLSVKEDELTQFIHDLFDLKKMDISIPTKAGIVPLTFLKKEFLTSNHKELIALDDLKDIKNLPLNFITQLTESNKAFFEDSPIFDSIYTDFTARNWKEFRLNDAYKVRITKWGKVVQGYLSAYPPIPSLEEGTKKTHTGKELYLYSQPITTSSQERELVTRRDDKGKPTKNPVVIKDTDQSLCDMEILDRQINLNGDAFGALLFGYVLGKQSLNTTMSAEKEKELAEKIGDLEVYKDTEKWEDELTTDEDESKKEKPEQDKFMEVRKHQLKWFRFSEEKYKENFGFVEWTRLFIPFFDSEVPPVESGKAWLQIEIIAIDTTKWTFKIKFHGGELNLGKSEWIVKELPIHPDSFAGIKKHFGPNIYKVPDIKWVSFDDQMNNLKIWGIYTDADKNFGSTVFDWSKFTYTLGNYTGKDITHFGLYEPQAIGEAVNEESGKLILYKIKVNSNGTINVSGDSMKTNIAKNFSSRDMDYTTFMLFIKEKWLQPKCKEQTQAINVKVTEDSEIPTTVRGFSISNIIGFFTNGISKLKEGIKKYDDERTEDLTDVLTSNGKLWSSIWWFLSPFSKISSSFESMGMEYYLERDNRVWKKVEKRVKFYEDYDYSKFYDDVIWPMLTWKIEIVPHYKIAAILLVHLKKGKWPHAKSIPIAEGSRVGKLLGPVHKKNYLFIREKKIIELEQNAHRYPTAWADNIKDELVELEMRYIVHVMDGRQLWTWDADKAFFQAKYSKHFCDELETAYTWFYKQSTVDEWFTKAETANFEFARIEYFRQLVDRPQQALPYLKVMAMKAINDTQWQVFETAVLAGILSGVFLNMTTSKTQSYIQKICRTRWFIPWIYAKDIRQQYKMQRLLDLFSDGEFTSTNKYSASDYSFRNTKLPKDFFNPWLIPLPKWPTFLKWMETWNTRSKLSGFFALTGKNVNKKTLLDLHANSDPDKKISPSDKLLLEEFIEKSNEKNGELDPEVQKNTTSLTWSILTKSQSVVEQMIRFDRWEFAGKTWDEKEDMKIFSREMEAAIPKDSIASTEKVKFFLGKFINRFGEKFSWTKKTDLLKRLKWCQKNKDDSKVDNVLYYGIVWEIISGISSNSNVPDELSWALWAWQNFFKQNIDTIPAILIDLFGGISYKDDYDNANPGVESRESCVNLLDRNLAQTAFLSLSPEQRKATNARIQKIKTDQNVLNFPLYELAEKLYRNNGIINRFKDSTTNVEKSSNGTQKPPKKIAWWAKIQNPKIIENLRKVLQGQDIDDDRSEEDRSEEFDLIEDDNNY